MWQQISKAKNSELHDCMINESRCYILNLATHLKYLDPEIANFIWA